MHDKGVFIEIKVAGSDTTREFLETRGVKPDEVPLLLLMKRLGCDDNLVIAIGVTQYGESRHHELHAIFHELDSEMAAPDTKHGVEIQRFHDGEQVVDVRALAIQSIRDLADAIRRNAMPNDGPTH